MDDDKLKQLREKRRKEVKMFSMLKEIAAYLIYVMVICTLSYDNRDPKSFWSNNELSNLFVKDAFNHVRHEFCILCTCLTSECATCIR